MLRVNLGFSEPIGLGVPRIHYLRFAGTHCVTVKVDGLRECKDANYVVSSRVNPIRSNTRDVDYRFERQTPEWSTDVILMKYCSSDSTQLSTLISSTFG